MIDEPLTVLLFEDTLDDERLALRALRGSGLPLCVQVARDGDEALRMLGLGGATAYCVKPVDYVQYVECVVRLARRWLERNGSPSEGPCVLASTPGPAARCEVL